VAKYDRSELEAMREKVAEANGFQLYRQYGEDECAHILKVDPSTLKRWRREGKVPFVNYGQRKVRYLGLFIADMMLGLHNGEV
jgi:hypothetical protein